MTERSDPAARASTGRPPGGDIPALTGLRFVAAFSVMFAHGMSTLLAHYEAPQNAVHWLAQASAFGMTLFFVLSGFVIHYNYAALVTDGGRSGTAAYLWARFSRLYPLFLLMLVVNILVSSRHFDAWRGHPERLVSMIEALPYFLLSIHSWVYVPIEGNGLISAIGGGSPITWSISTEWFFYVLYPAIAWLVLRSRRPQTTVVALGLWCVLWFALAAALHDSAQEIDRWAVAQFGAVAGMRENPQDSFVRWLLYFSPYLRMGEFVLGALAAQLYVQRREKPVGRRENAVGTAVMLAAAVGACAIVYLCYAPGVGMNLFRKTSMNFALAPTVAILIFFAARCDNVASRLLGARPAVLLGEASYSIYLLHYVVFTAVVRLSGPPAQALAYDIAKLVVVMAAILALSAAMYAWYEAPARIWLRRQWGNKPVVVALLAGLAGLALAFAILAQFV